MHNNPFKYFDNWYATTEKLKIDGNSAFCMSTVDLRGIPNARMLELKEYTDEGFIFYTNYNSKKGVELEYNPRACMVFHWPAVHRQVRIRGVINKLSREKSDKYFQTRDKESKIISVLSNQSEVMDSTENFSAAIQELSNQFEISSHIPSPDHWGGYILIPNEFEFWEEGDVFTQRHGYLLINNEWRFLQYYP